MKKYLILLLTTLTLVLSNGTTTITTCPICGHTCNENCEYIDGDCQHECQYPLEPHDKLNPWD